MGTLHTVSSFPVGAWIYWEHMPLEAVALDLAMR